MSFFKASTDKKDLEQNSGGNYINKSGVYDVNLIVPFVSVSKGGSTVVDLFVDYNGQKQPVYGNMRITNNNGEPNKIGSKVFNQLVIIAGVEEVSEPVDAELPIGKKGAAKDVPVLEDLSDIDVTVHVQMEYSVNNGNIQESKVIRGFYRTDDKASAEEIVNGANAGTQYEKNTKFFESDYYRDGLEEEQVKEWIKAGRPKGTANGGSSSSTSKTPSFSKKKTFGK